jgi:hypothetical protein
MPWVTATKIEQESRVRELDNGYDFNPAFRSRFIYFKFSGLRPNDNHWLFLQNRDVTAFANTSFSINDFNASARSSVFRNPGDKYLFETQFPSDLGGPSGTPLTTTASGELEGVLFLQSNSTYSWRCGTGSTNYSYNGGDNSIPLLAINISTTDKAAALSHATAEYSSIGQFINYSMETYSVDVEVEYEVWEDDPPPAPGPTITSGNDNDTGPSISTDYEYFFGSTDTGPSISDADAGGFFGDTWTSSARPSARPTTTTTTTSSWMDTFSWF